MIKINKNNLNGFRIFSLILLLAAVWIFSEWPGILQSPLMPFEIKKTEAATEIRYMGADQQSVNNLTAYLLSSEQTAIEQSSVIRRTGGGGDTVNWGIRAWKRSEQGVETEITNGTPVAQVSRNSIGEGIQSAIWASTQTSLENTDSVVIRAYAEIVGQINWTLQGVFTTEQLGATVLSGSVWTVYYYTKYDGFNTGAPSGRFTEGIFYWGDAFHNSRIENFSWGVVSSASWKADSDVPASAAIDEIIRLRVQVANTGSDAVDYDYLLQYAVKDGAYCDGNESFNNIPLISSGEPFEMSVSDYVNDGDQTTNGIKLPIPEGCIFVPGRIVANPSNSSGSFNLSQNNYTEFEFVLKVTEFASGSYCFRLTNNGNPFDLGGEGEYVIYPELTI